MRLPLSQNWMVVSETDRGFKTEPLDTNWTLSILRATGPSTISNCANWTPGHRQRHRGKKAGVASLTGGRS